MIALIFEVEAKEEGRDAYLARAANLRASLEQMDGFVAIERFESLSQPGKLLSLSFFENEEAVRQWREFGAHQDAQRAGRESLFKDYRIRVAHVVRDYGMHDRAQKP